MAHATVQELVEEPIFSKSDLLANIGGYLGLCLGASMLSLYEWGAACFAKLYLRRIGKRGHSAVGHY